MTRASILAGRNEIPAYVRLADDQQMLEMALIENIQREDLNAIEISVSFKRLLEQNTNSASTMEISSRSGLGLLLVNISSHNDFVVASI